MTVPVLGELTGMNVVEYVESGTFLEAPVLKVILKLSIGSPGRWKNIQCNGNILGKGLELCFLVDWQLGQGRLWVTQEGVWIQSCRKWGATDRLYSGDLHKICKSQLKFSILESLLFQF